MRIVAVRLDQFGAGNYRITNPMLALEKLGHEVEIIQAGYGLRVSSRQLIGDALILQRQNDLMYYDLVASLPPELRPRVVYEIDDLLWNFHGMNNPGAALEKDLQRTVPPMIRKADAVFCSTPELARKCQEFNQDTHVLLNAIDYQIRDWGSNHEGFPLINNRKVIGWSGGGWHDGDWDVMGKSLRNALLSSPGWCFLAQGDPVAILGWVKKAKLPKGQVVIADWMEFGEHPSIYSLFDIGIAPLMSNAYNNCKSELKLIELGARGIPYVASDCSAYRRFYRNTGGFGGYLAKTEKEWDYLLRQAMSDIHHSKMLKSLTAEHYSLEARAKEYEKALYSVTREERWSKTIAVR